jgi:hypothetical protein
LAHSNQEKRDQHVQNLEHIVRHFLGDVPLDEENIGRIAARCSSNINKDMQNLLKVNESFDVQFVSGNVACGLQTPPTTPSKY